MAITGYLKFVDPEIAGESQYSGHEDEVEIHWAKWRITNKASVNVGSGYSQSRSEVGAIYMYKWFDAASVYISQAAMQGTAINEALLIVRKESGEALDYLQITMKRGVICHYEMLDPVFTGDETELQSIRECFGIAFEFVDQKYIEQNPDGSAGTEHQKILDIETGEPG